MSSEGVGQYEAEDIRSIVDRVLRDLGYPEPPLRLPQVRALLELNLGYYSSANTTLLQEVAHRLKVAGKQILERPMILVEAVQKAKLSALWVPDAKRILIDSAVPRLKHRWIEGHEIGHSLIPWHREFLFGDDEYTLDPACHAIVEAEANYAASQLLFLQGRFAAEARDCQLSFTTIKEFATRYNNTITSTLWRMVEDREPNTPIFGMISSHPHHTDIGGRDDGERVRYFIRSAAFRSQFQAVTPLEGYALIVAHASQNRTGPVVNALCELANSNGERCEFRVESFSNHHALLTYGVMTRVIPTLA